MTQRVSFLKPFCVLFLIFVFVGLGGVVQWSHARTNLALDKLTKFDLSQEVVPNAEAVKLFSLGYDKLLADIYWLAFVQYIGDPLARTLDHSTCAYRYLDLITFLDPQFIQPYWFAAFTIGAEENKPDLAQKIIERGIENNRDNWSLPFIAGINQYLFAHNDVAAAKFYKMAAKYPGAPPWLARQAAILQARIPSFVKEINIYSNIYDSNGDALVRKRAHDKLISLWSQIYKLSPNEEIRKRAAKALSRLEYESNQNQDVK